ncbi:hypothetical protein FK220_011485 [Flavobacteriaceae bacterium TP-CH-4]|uniref:Uncharacterized protein n=1 Tax=Pelagihabitans pacificus TaxID=2696054 RepID=A0A967AYK9_9FLAO|nr:hypothetical protein [Pelagihabitans pacificus]NHF59967.1 hypothetical protein [Pelagihabitans pacificus]
MRKKIHFLLLLFIFASCSSDNDRSVVLEDDDSSMITGMQSFSIDFTEITAKNISNKTLKALEPAFALISIANKDGSTVLTREKIAVQKIDGKLITEAITLAAGTYSLTEFIITDATNVVISLVPMGSATLAQLVETSLPFDFRVEADKTNVSPTENLEAAGLTAVDFGYGQLNLEFPEATDFFSLSIDESTLITGKTLVLKSLTASDYVIDWGDGTIDEYTSTGSDVPEENALTHTYAEMNAYIVNISGPLEVITYFKFQSNDQANSFQSNVVSVDIKKLTSLRVCELYAGKLTTLDTSQNVVLETLSLGYNQLTSLDLNNNTALKTLWLRYNQLTELDVSRNVDLEFLWVTGNQISGLDVSNASKLESLLARENQLTFLNVANNPALRMLDLSDNLLPSIDISSNSNLEEINVGRNALTAIDLSNNGNLQRIDLYGNQIAAIDVSANLLLRDLYIDGNLLMAIDLSNNPEMERLIIGNNDLSDLDLSNNPKILNLEIGGNQFSALQLDQIITHIYDQAVLNAIMDGYMDFQNNPGTNDITGNTTTKIEELISTYNWSFNNN